MRVRSVGIARMVVALVVAVAALCLCCNSEPDNCPASQTKVCLPDGTSCTCAPTCSQTQDCYVYSWCAAGACTDCSAGEEGCGCWDNSVCLPVNWPPGETVTFQAAGTSAAPTGNYPCDPQGSAAPVCGLSYGTTHAFYSCTQQSDCVPNTVCIDNDGDHAYYCKPLCTTTSGECESFVSIDQCTPGTGGGGACTIALCANGKSSGVGVCEGPGSTLPPSYDTASCCE